MAQMIPVSRLRLVLDLEMSGEFSDDMHIRASDAADSPELRAEVASAALAGAERVLRKSPPLAAVSVTCRPA